MSRSTASFATVTKELKLMISTEQTSTQETSEQNTILVTNFIDKERHIDPQVNHLRRNTICV
jgi:hypothetical protein